MKYIATLAAAMALAFPTSALAASGSTCQAYNPQLCSVTVQSATSSPSRGTTAGDATASGTLPFTGLDAILLVAGGGTLAATGLVLRGLSRRID